MVRPAVAAVLVTIVSMTWGVPALAGDAEPVDDVDLVDALVDAAETVGWSLDEDCVADVVATGDVENLDDPLGRSQLLVMLALTADEATMSSSPVDFIIDPGGGVLSVNAPTVFDSRELRRQLLLCVAGSADPDLVDQVATILADSDADGFFDHECVERVLSVVPDDTLRLLIDAETMTTPPADFDEKVFLSDISRLIVCRSETTNSTTDP